MASLPTPTTIDEMTIRQFIAALNLQTMIGREPEVKQFYVDRAIAYADLLLKRISET